MSRRTSRWILWIGLALTVPVPVLILGPGLVPAARLLMLGGICIAVMLAESSRGAVGWTSGLLLGQALLYLALLWLAAHGASRLLARLPHRAAAGLTIGLLAVGVALASSFEIYHTPFAPRSARASLLEVFR